MKRMGKAIRGFGSETKIEVFLEGLRVKEAVEEVCSKHVCDLLKNSGSVTKENGKT